MATINITQRVSIDLTIEVPDSKLKQFLENHRDMGALALGESNLDRDID